MSNAATRSGLYAKSLSQQRTRLRNDSKETILTAGKVIAVILLAALFYLWGRLEIVSLGYDMAKANKERTELIYDNKRLKLEILSLKSPQRIEAVASDKLGLVYPKGAQIIIIR